MVRLWESTAKSVTVVCSLVLLVIAMSAQEASNPTETRIIALENAWNQAQLHHDAKALASLVHQNFIYTDYDGTQMNKAQFLEDTKDHSYRPIFVANEGVKVYLYDNVAIVTGTYHTKGSYKGRPFEHWGRFTDTWLNRDNHWMCVASHTNLVKE